MAAETVMAFTQKDFWLLTSSKKGECWQGHAPPLHSMQADP